VADKPQSASGPVDWYKRLDLWGKVLAPVVVGVVVLLLGTQLTGGDDKASLSGQRPSGPPKDVIQQIERRDVWTTSPQIFKSAKDLPDISTDITLPVDAESLQPTIVTPTQLARHGVDYDGQTIVLVGRVVDEVSVTRLENENGYREGIGGEIRLAGTRDSGAYVGTSYSTSDRGEVVWVVGRVAAIGMARTVDGRPLRAAYFLAGGDVQSADSGYSDDYPPKLRAALRSEAGRPLLP